ncbi:MAG TPA: hypothetical protein VGC70_02295, partial [Burkholderiales bacterium]
FFVTDCYFAESLGAIERQTVMKRLSTALLLLIAVLAGGCVAVPAGPGYYPSEGYYPPAPAYPAAAPAYYPPATYYPAPAYYYGPPAYYGPSFSVGIFGGSRWHGGSRGGWRGGRGYRR